VTGAGRGRALAGGGGAGSGLGRWESGRCSEAVGDVGRRGRGRQEPNKMNMIIFSLKQIFIFL